MKNMLPVRYLLLTLCFGVFAILQAHSQMKIGNHPSTIHPASILELESTNQALRLTQGDTLDVNGIIGSDSHSDKYIAAEGMIMYNVKDSSVYMRTQGLWRKIVSLSDVDSSFWSLKGNEKTDSTKSFLGTLDQEALNIGASGNKYMIIHSDGRVDVLGDSLFVANNTGFAKSVTIADSLKVNSALNVTHDSVYFGKPLAINDSIVIHQLGDALASDTSVMVISPGGIVRKMSLNSIGIRSVNGVTGPYLHLKFDTVSVGHTGPWVDSTTNLGASTLTLNIPDASATVRGLVSDTTQIFGGNKSFENTVAIGTTDTATSTLQVNGNVGMSTHIVPTATATYNMEANTAQEANYRTIIFDVSSSVGGVMVTLPDATKIDGRIYTFKKIGLTTDGQLANPVKINTTGAQTIDGDSNNFTIYNNFTSVSLQAQGGNWYIVH